MKNIAYLFGIFLLWACATPMRASRPDFLSGLGPQGVTTREIEKDLTRGQNLFGQYQIEAYPYTEPLIRLRATEEGKRTLASDKEIEKKIAEELRALVRNHTCFHFLLETTDIDSGYFRRYVSKVEDHKGVLHPISYVDAKGVGSVPRPGGASMGWSWSNNTVGCTDKIDLASGFKLHFMPLSETLSPVVMAWTAGTAEPEPKKPAASKISAY